MNYLNWYDWITPTNPYSSIFFGIISTIVIAFVIWFDTKKLKTVGLTVITGLCMTAFGVIFLHTVGYYG